MYCTPSNPNTREGFDDLYILRLALVSFPPTRIPKLIPWPQATFLTYVLGTSSEEE